MELYMAPLEGLTTYIFRNAYNKYFGGIDRYYSPFIHGSKTQKMTFRETSDIHPDNNSCIVIPQVLTSDADAFIRTAEEIKNLGYDEINLNLGCPSGTVVAKGRGSGFLGKPFELDRFLYTILEKVPMKISIKTRIGKNDPDEFYDLADIYKKYDFSEVIIHPRTRSDFYKNTPNLNMFALGYDKITSPVCYNGDIVTVEDYNNIIRRFDKLEKVMIGRGLLYNPGLPKEIRTGEKLLKNNIREFHDELFEEYKIRMSGDKNALYKMKNIWEFMSFGFENSEKYVKKIRKSEKIKDYNDAVHNLFSDCDLKFI